MFALAGNPVYDDLTYLYFMETRYFLLAGIIFVFPTARYCRDRFGNSIIWKALYPAVFLLFLLICTGYIVNCTFQERIKQ